MADDFEEQVDALIADARRDLEGRGRAIEARNAARGLYRSSATIKTMQSACEEVYDDLIAQLANEIRFFYENTGRAPGGLIEVVKKRLQIFEAGLFRFSGLSKLFSNLGTSDGLKSRVSHEVSGLTERADRALRRLEIEMSAFRRMMTENFQLVSASGEIKNARLPGRLIEGKVMTFEVSTPIERDDHLLRMLPNGVVEDYIVEEPSYKSGLHGHVDDYYQIDVRDSGRPAASAATMIKNITHNYNFSGAGARQYIHSTDNSTNVIDQSAMAVFQNLAEKAKAEIADPKQAEPILRAIKDMETAAGTPTFSEKYHAFIQSAAAHMTVFAPLMPALTIFLQG